MTKEDQIAGLLSQGTAPAELVHQGYARSTVYKMAKRLAETDTSQLSENKGGPDVDLEVENDPAIIQLKKDLRKAHLERQIAEIRAPIDLEARLIRIEEELDEGSDALSILREKVDGSPLAGIRQRFKCSCGTEGLVAAGVRCTNCGREATYGWHPK